MDTLPAIGQALWCPLQLSTMAGNQGKSKFYFKLFKVKLVLVVNLLISNWKCQGGKIVSIFLPIPYHYLFFFFNISFAYCFYFFLFFFFFSSLVSRNLSLGGRLCWKPRNMAEVPSPSLVLFFFLVNLFFFNIDCSGGEEIRDWVSFLSSRPFLLGLGFD